jgi:hypothetical protein
LVRDYFDPEVEQSEEEERKAERIISSGIPPGKMTGDAKRAHVAKSEAGGATPAGKMTGDAKRAHTDKSEAGGAIPPGKMTGDAKRAHVTKIETGGGTPAGAMTGDAKRAHTEACEAGGSTPAGARLSDEDVLHQMIGRFIKKKKDESPIVVSRLTVCTDSENTYTFYASRDALLEDYKAVSFVLYQERHRKLYDIVCTSGAKRTSPVLPLSNESSCEGDAIGGEWVSSRNAWKGWSSDAYSNLKKEGVTWRVEDVRITDDMVRAHKLEKAAKKAKAVERAVERKKKRKRLALSAPGPGVGKRRTT